MKTKTLTVVGYVFAFFISMYFFSTVFANWDVFFHNESWNEFVFLPKRGHYPVWIVLCVIFAIAYYKKMNVKSTS